MRTSEVTWTWLKSQLDGVDGSGGSYMAWCPAHDDLGTAHKGLSITVRNEGQKNEKILCKCWSCGAQLPEILLSLNGGPGVEVKVKSHKSKPVSDGMQWWVSKTQVPATVWNRLGCVEHELGVAFTFHDEPARKIRIKGGKEWRWVPKGASAPPLWPMPDWELPEHIGLYAGESDCGTAHAAGLPYGFAVTKGEGTSLSSLQFQALASRGVQEVDLCGDTDDTGQVFTAHMVKGAIDAGLTVNIIDLRMVLDPFSGLNDLNDVWRAAEDEAHFHELIARATYRYEEKDEGWSDEAIFAIAKQEVEWMIPNLIAPSDKVLISGPQKSFKTWLTIDLVRSLTTGVPFLGRGEWKPDRHYRVCFVEEEGNPTLFAKRLSSMGKIQNLNVLHRRGIRFTESDTISYLISYCRKHQSEVLILDPMQRMLPGVDENSANESGVVWDEVFRIQQALPGLVVAIVHHANKGETLTWSSIRGSSRHGGEVDLGIFIDKHPLEKDVIRVGMDGRDVAFDTGPGEAFEVEFSKGETFAMTVRDQVQVIVKSHQKSQKNTNRDAILQGIRDGANTRTKLMRLTELSDATIREHLTLLVEEGLVTESIPGRPKPNIYEISEPLE